jgi:hypothetical protein
MGRQLRVTWPWLTKERNQSIMGLYTIPPAVRNLIDLINACGDQEMDIISVNEPDEFPAIAKKLSKVTDKFEPIARDYVWTGSDLLEDFETAIEDAIRRFDALRRGRIMLERIVRLSRRPHAKRSSIMLTSSTVSLDELQLAKSGRRRLVKDKLITPYEIRIVKRPSLLDALDHCPARIRRCHASKCERFFWAGRDTKTGCSDLCNAAIRQARRRKRLKGTK